jgi:hypothetical protein
MPKPSSSGAFIRGVDASTGVLLEPKGSVPRASNLILNKRGSLETCDGSKILAAYLGFPVLTRGAILEAFFFQPIGVAGYYLLVAQALDQPLRGPYGLLAADGGAGGTLPASVTLFYKVTACDGLGGETAASNEVSFAQSATPHKVNLTWNIVPNAAYYNIYRSTASGAEVLVASSKVAVQPPLGNLTVTFVDDGSLVTFSTTIASMSSQTTAKGVVFTYITNAPHNLIPGSSIVTSGTTPSGYSLGRNVTTVPSPTSFTFALMNVNPLPPGTGGTVSSGFPSPLGNKTQQLALIKVPAVPSGQIATYTQGSIVALLPANPSAASQLGAGTGGTSGGGGGGGGTGGTLTLVPTRLTMTPGDVDPLSAISNGADVSNLSVWASSNTGVATVDATGNVTAIGVGVAQISAVYGGQTAFASVTVNRGA